MGSFRVSRIGYCVIDSPDPLPTRAKIDAADRVIWLSAGLSARDRDRALANAVAKVAAEAMGRAMVKQ